MTDKRILIVKAALAFLLVTVSAAMLFVPVAAGSEEVRAMFLMLTGIAVRDFFGATQEDKRIKEIRNAYDPQPPPPHFRDEDS